MKRNISYKSFPYTAHFHTHVKHCLYSTAFNGFRDIRRLVFLCCRIALDSCGQIVARSQKEIENQLTHGNQQETTQPTPTNQGKGELK